jgi:signal transduction histidine kinase
MLTSLCRAGRVRKPPGVADHRVPIVGVVVVAIIMALAIVRELLAPDVRIMGYGADLVGASEPPPNYVRPFSLLVMMVTEMYALTRLARWLDQRAWRPVWNVVATSALAIALGALYAILFKSTLHVAAPMKRILVTGPIGGMQIYTLWVLAFRYPQIVDDARVRALEAEGLRRAAELSRLREHLQPHFLRNTLNTIAALVRDEPDTARDLLAALGDLLANPPEPDDPMHTLGEEIAWLRRYSEIFAARHRGALRFRWDLDPAASSVPIPRLLLQPLVENAVHHGALARSDGGDVVVQTRRTERGIVVVVQDDGPGMDLRRPNGLGLHLVRRRLAMECRDASLRIESSASGTRAIVELR